MDASLRKRRWMWVTLGLSSVTIVAIVFAVWELFEAEFFRNVDYITLHYLYISRGIVSSLILAFWAAWFVLRERQANEERLRRSREHYRGILESTPGAVVLCDREIRVWEWNAAAERLYGYSKDEVVGHPLRTVPASREAEFKGLLKRVDAGFPVLEVESQRKSKSEMFAVQLSLIPFRESSGESYFLEITYDIRERLRLRERLLEIEKLTTMGQMAAGTAHHLNTPLASMLLRVQMMRERTEEKNSACELEQLETHIKSCQQFVRRLLDFSHRSNAEKQLESVSNSIESVVSFLNLQLLAKNVRLNTDLGAINGDMVLGERGQLEALFLILLSNSLDATPPGGGITVRGRTIAHHQLEIEIADEGSGIESAVLPRIFEPFFTTKPIGKGTGLGLAIASNIVREHGGSIRILSEPGKGTSAIVGLPCQMERKRTGDQA